MPKIIIKDLPKDQKITKEEMRALLGGAVYTKQTILPQGEDLLKTKTVLALAFGVGDDSITLYGGK